MQLRPTAEDAEMKATEDGLNGNYAEVKEDSWTSRPLPEVSRHSDYAKFQCYSHTKNSSPHN